MPRPVTADVHVNKLLTNLSIGYLNIDYIGATVFPLVKVLNTADYYASWGASQFRRNEAHVVAPGTPSPRIGFKPTLTNSYTCRKVGISGVIPTEVKANADSALQLQATYTMGLADQILLDREVRVAAIINTYTNWTNYTTLTGTDQWNDYNNSTPVTTIDTYIEAVYSACLRRPNTMVIGLASWKKLRRHPDILKLCFNDAGYPQIVTSELLAKALEIERVLVGRASYTADEEAESVATAATYTDIWGDYCWVGYVAPAPAMMTPSAGYTFQYDYYVRTWFEDAPNSDVIECVAYEVPTATCADAGALIIDTVA